MSPLEAELVEMAERRERPPCGEGDWPAWTSEEADDRAVAARCCAGCPLTRVCLSEAVDAKVNAGVWGGVDFTTKGAKRRAERRLAELDEIRPDRPDPVDPPDLYAQRDRTAAQSGGRHEKTNPPVSSTGTIREDDE